MNLQLKISHRGLIIVVVPLLVVFVLLGSLASLLRQAETEVQQEAHSREVVTHINIMLRQLVSSGSNLLAYYLSRERSFLKDYGDRRAQVVNEMWKLASLVKNERQQLDQLARTSSDIDRLFAVAGEMERSAGRPMSVIAMLEGRAFFEHMYKCMDRVADDLDPLLKNAERTVEASPEAQARSRGRIQAVIYGGMLATVVLALSMTYLFSRGITSRLKVLTDNTGRLARQQRLAAPVGGKDEIGELDLFFHRMAQDLADARRRERAILDNAVDVICSINADGVFTAVNPASMHVWGYAPDKLTGRHFSEIIVKEDSDKFREALDEIRRKKLLVNVENRVLSAGGRTVHTLWSLNWSEPEQSLFCVAHDISDRKEVERLKQEFVAMISHELRTPLTSLRALLSLLSSGAYGQLSENGEKRLQSAEVGITRLIGLINDLLDIEKMEAGKLVISPAELDLSDVVERAIDAVQGFAEQQGVRITACKRSQIAVADFDRIVQVMVNLLSNAIKFSDEGGEVEVKMTEESGYSEVQVIDHGCGIPAGSEKSIFEKYEQAHAPDGKRRKGTGLGLPICKAIIEQHGGAIGVRATEGGGSTLWFRLRLAEGHTHV